MSRLGPLSVEQKKRNVVKRAKQEKANEVEKRPQEVSYIRVCIVMYSSSHHISSFRYDQKTLAKMRTKRQALLPKYGFETSACTAFVTLITL